MQRLEEEGEHLVVPAWRRITQGEPRWPVSLALVVAITLQVLLPSQVATRPRWLLPILAAFLLGGILFADPRRVEHESPRMRGLSMAVIAVISLANAWSAERLVIALVRGAEHQEPGALLITGASVWLTNVIVFSLWYWELDRGGPVACAKAPRPHPDFLFPQMDAVDLAPPEWEPAFADYLYLSFTNATAFSPTDTLPLSRWAKMLMMLQSAISLTAVALVIARAVNILK